MTWTNWSGRVRVNPADVASPSSAQELSALVRTATEQGRRVKAVGSGHSFTPIAATDGLLLRLDHLTGPIAVDLPARRVRVRAGTPLHRLNRLLDELGLALPNLGDIDRQTISGAIATGTHGTGLAFQGIAAAVVGLTLVLADGAQLTCSTDEHPDVFAAARVSLGALGVITEVELQCVPAFRLHARESVEPLDAFLEGLDGDLAAHDHVDSMFFPHSDQVQVKRNQRLIGGGGPAPLPAWRAWTEDEVIANAGLALVSRATAVAPTLTTRINRVSAALLSQREYADVSWKVFCSSRRVRFVESEYAVPLESVRPVVAELRAWFERSRTATPFPVELRFLGADDCWLSTGFERVNAYVAVHQYTGMDERGLFDAFGRIVAEHAGRPHWGKVHDLDAERLGPLYPRFADFLAVRDRLDPGRTFANPYLDRVLGR